MKNGIIILTLLWMTLSVNAQTDSLEFDFARFIYLDSITITASRSGFDSEEFIEMVQADSSFYRAFRNLRFVNYTAENDIQFYDKKDQPAASYRSKTTQQVQQEAQLTCRTMRIESEQIEGKYYKKSRKPRYYTTKMYERLFFTKEKTCEASIDAPASEDEPDGKIAKYVAQLKKLIFQPGEKVDIPIIGNKTAIFDEKMAEYYDYSIESKIYKNGIDCYVFGLTVKPEYQSKKTDKTVVKFLETYFEKKTFQVIARNYRVAYYGALFDFDVTMNVELKKLEDNYFPEFISYDGFWKVPTQKLEKAKFTIQLESFEY